MWEIKRKYVRKAFKLLSEYDSKVEFSSNGRLLVSASELAGVQLWDMRHGIVKLFGTCEDPCSWTQFIPGERYVAASSQKRVTIWDVHTGRLVKSVAVNSYPLATMPDGTGMIIVSDKRVMKYWDISSLNTGCIDERFPTVGPGGCDSGVGNETSPERKFIGHKVGFFIFLALKQSIVLQS